MCHALLLLGISVCVKSVGHDMSPTSLALLTTPMIVAHHLVIPEGRKMTTLASLKGDNARIVTNSE